MIEVSYSEKKFLLTNQELKEALPVWAKKRTYYCARIEAILPPYYRWAAAPPEDVGFEVFLAPREDSFYKVFKRDGVYYKQSSYNYLKKSPYNEKSLNEIKGSLIPQEEYYQQKKYLPAP